ncbi:MFS transporter [Arthrobacter sp. UYCu723]
MIDVDISIVIAALPEIRAELGFSTTDLSWIQNAYTLAFGGLLLLGARAGDILGRRRMFVLGLALFTVASLAVGLALSPAWLLTARVLQGVGAATLVPRRSPCSRRSSPKDRNAPAPSPLVPPSRASVPASASSSAEC